ncbi:MAG: metal-dependent transcriptional regulator [Saccharofermentans sp.]|nr:metal-dependent transcriptional regulator [Saccharofermentans sp.]
MNKLGLGESSEDYLEAMLQLKEKNGYIRSVDIAEHLGVTKPSVSNAIKRLKEKGYIEMNSSSFISLTETGKAIALKVYDRHQTLTNLFVSLGVDEATAADDACRVEHVISDQTFDALKKLSKK